MKQPVALLVLSLNAPAAIASDMGALVYLTLLQYVFFLWPVVLPLAYVHNRAQKTQLYLLLVLVVFGIMGVVRYPYALLLTFGDWSPGEAHRSAAAINIAINALAFLVCLWYLPRVRALFGKLHEGKDA